MPQKTLDSFFKKPAVKRRADFDADTNDDKVAKLILYILKLKMCISIIVNFRICIH